MCSKPSIYHVVSLTGITLSMLFSASSVDAHGLHDVLHQVEHHAPQLHTASARADASDAGVRVIKSQYWGHAETFATTTHYNNKRLVNPISYPQTLTASSFDQNTYGFGAAYTLPIDIDGRITAQVHAQEQLSQAAHQSAAQTRLSVFAQTVQLYRGLQRLEGIKQAHLAHLEALQDHQKVTQASVRVGRVAAVELLRIEAEIQSVEGLLAGVKGDEIRLRAALGALMNQAMFAEVVEPLKVQPETKDFLEHQDTWLKHRPDLLAAQSVNRAENENLKRAKDEWLPALSLRAETMHQKGYQANGATTWSVNAQLTWQVWDGGRRSANSDRAQANREVARQQYQSTWNQAKAELLSAEAGWQAASEQYEAATYGLKAATETERIQSDRFHHGRISAVDLIDAEAALARARADETTALASWWLADDQLYLAEGNAPSAYSKSGEQ